MASTTIIPAGKPPAGVQSNFVNPYYGGAKFIGVSSFFLTLAVVVVVLRTYTRIVIQRCFAADDCKWKKADTFSMVDRADLMRLRYYDTSIGSSSPTTNMLILRLIVY